MKYKIYCIFAQESIDKMGGNVGKLAAQAGHAYLHAFWNAFAFQSEPLDEEVSQREAKKRVQAARYKASEHAYKICLVVPTVAELKTLLETYKDICGVALIKDAGFTVFEEPTITCLGIGPISEDNIGEDIKSLPLLR